MLLATQPVSAQEKKKDKEQLKADYLAAPLYQGTSVALEVAGVGGYLLGGDILSSEVQVQTNLKNRFLPTLEIGYGKTDAINQSNELHYKTSAPYLRIGMDYNIFYLKPYLPGYLYAGVRYGMSSFSYDVNGPDMTDPNYGGEISVPFSSSGVKSKAQWLEGTLGIKVKIYRNFHMGWCLRYKMRLSISGNENSVPWYVPGFGKNASSGLNISYNLIYNLPF